jgi:hypothetical protein
VNKFRFETHKSTAKIKNITYPPINQNFLSIPYIEYPACFYTLLRLFRFEHSKKRRVDSTRRAVGFVCRSTCRFNTPACDWKLNYACRNVIENNKTMRVESTRVRVESTRMRVVKKTTTTKIKLKKAMPGAGACRSKVYVY